MKCFLILCLSLVLGLSVEARKRRINVPGALKESLNHLLQSAHLLQKACYSQDEPQIATQLRNLALSVKKTQRTNLLTKQNASHLNKILLAIQSEIKTVQYSKDMQRKKSLKKMFKQVVQLVKVYNLDKYYVFFCSKDKSVWIQKSRTPQNPINPKKYKNCGRRV